MSTVAATLQPSWRAQARRLRLLVIETAAVAFTTLSEMPFLDHLEELRRRLLKSLVAIVVALLVCLTNAAELIGFLRLPASRIAGFDITIVGGTEIFSLYFKASLLAAICLAAPVVLWQIWQFIAPGLHRHERRYAGPFLISTTLSFMGGAVFGFGVLLPIMLEMTITMAKNAGLQVTMSALSYLDLVTMIVLSMGVVFEIPPVIFVLCRIGLVNARFLARNFKYAVLLSFVGAAILTPSTDASPMLLIAIPMIALYAVGIVVALVFGKARKPAE